MGRGVRLDNIGMSIESIKDASVTVILDLPFNTVRVQMDTTLAAKLESQSWGNGGVGIICNLFRDRGAQEVLRY